MPQRSTGGGHASGPHASSEFRAITFGYGFGTRNDATTAADNEAGEKCGAEEDDDDDSDGVEAAEGA